MEIGTYVWVKGLNGEWAETVIKAKTLDFNGNPYVTTAKTNDCDELMLSTPKGCIETQEIKLRNETDHREKIKNMNQLCFLNEPEILEVLRANYKKQQCGTYYNSSVLLYMRPHNKQQGNNFSESIVGDQILEQLAHEVKKQTTIPLNLWNKTSSFVNSSIRSGFDDTQANATNCIDHSIIITGCSGSGKSGAAKAILGYLLKDGVSKSQSPPVAGQNNTSQILEASISTKNLQRSLSKLKSSASFHLYGPLQMEVFEKILKGSLILESFGNSRIRTNPNSSRYGQYLRIGFNQSGALVTGHFKGYLLQNSLVSKQSQNESNFHIFHQLVRGSSPEELLSFGLIDNPNCFRYLNQGAINKKMADYYPNKVADAEKFKALKDSLNDLEIDNSVIHEIFSILAAILHIGNLTFQSVDSEVTNETECVVEDTVTLALCAQLLGLPEQQLNVCLTGKRKLVIVDEEFYKNPNPAQAAVGRDSMCKFLYSKVFAMVMHIINDKVNKNSNGTSCGELSSNTISILDIFGFENLEVNQFQELLINYSSEKLQQHFSESLFAMELVEYDLQQVQYEGIVKPPKSIYPSEDNCCYCVSQLIGGGLFTLLDDLSKLQNPTYKKLASNLNTKFSKSKYFEVLFEDLRDSNFNIIHYAGKVRYTARDFIEKNLHELRPAVIGIVDSSTNTILNTQLDEFEGNETQLTYIDDNNVVAEQLPHRYKKIVTLASQFRSHLSHLLRDVRQSVPHFIRCLNANPSPKLNSFDAVHVKSQLHASGIMLTSESVLRAHFFAKIPVASFYKRYRIVLPSDYTSLPKFIAKDQDVVVTSSQTKILISLLQKIDKLELAVSSILAGSDIVYITSDAFEKLERYLVGPHKSAAALISNRGNVLLIRLHYLRTLHVTALVQRIIRGWLARRRYKALYAKTLRGIDVSARTIQCMIRCALSKKHVSQMKVEHNEWLLSMPRIMIAQELRLARRREWQKYADDSSSYITTNKKSDETLIKKKIDNFHEQEEMLVSDLSNMVDTNKLVNTKEVPFDVAGTRQLLEEWSKQVGSGPLRSTLVKLSGRINFGHLLLLPLKLIPLVGFNKLAKFTLKSKLHTRINSVKHADAKITSEHKMFKKINKMKSKLLYLSHVAFANQKAMNNNKGTKDFYVLADKICRLSNILYKYYDDYVMNMVEQYGQGSNYRKQFRSDEDYLFTLGELINKWKPLDKIGLYITLTKDENDENLDVCIDFPLKVTSTAKNHVQKYEDIYFRFMPYSPGFDFAMNSLSALFLPNDELYPSQLIRLVSKSTETYGMHVFYEASRNLSSDNFYDVLKDPVYVEQLDYPSLSAAILINLLTGAGDCAPENYMVSFMTNIKVVGAVGTDLFTSSAFDYYRMNKGDICCVEPTECDYHQFTGSGLNVLFFLPQMDEPIDPSIRAVFLHGIKHHLQSTADEIVCHWLRYLAKQNRSYELLISSGSFSGKDMQELHLPIQFPLTTALRLHSKLMELFDLLSNDEIASKFTHSDLLIHWYPKLGMYYKKQRQPTEKQITLANKVVPNETSEEAKIRVAKSIVSYHTLYEDQLDVIKKIRIEYEKNKTAVVKEIPTISYGDDVTMVNPLHYLSSPVSLNKSVYFDEIYGIEEYEVPDNHPINDVSEKVALMSPLTSFNDPHSSKDNSAFFGSANIEDNGSSSNNINNENNPSNPKMKDLTPVSQKQFLQSPRSPSLHLSANKSIYFDYIYEDHNQEVPETTNEIKSKYFNMQNSGKQLNDMSMLTDDGSIKSNYHQHILDDIGATNSSIEDIALQYIMTVDFEAYDSFSSPHICRVIGNSLSFIKTLWLRNISEEQLRYFFEDYYEQKRVYRLSIAMKEREGLSGDALKNELATMDIYTVKEVKLIGYTKEKFDILQKTITAQRIMHNLGIQLSMVILNEKPERTGLDTDLTNRDGICVIAATNATAHIDLSNGTSSVHHAVDYPDRYNVLLKKLHYSVNSHTVEVHHSTPEQVAHNITVVREVIRLCSTESSARSIPRNILKEFTKIFVTYPCFSTLGMEITVRGVFHDSPTVLHRMLASICVERYLDVIRYMLNQNPLLLFQRDEDMHFLPCDYIYLKVSDSKLFKYDLFAEMLNLIHKIYDVTSPTNSKVPTIGIPLSNTEAVLTKYHGEDELTTLAILYGFPATNVELKSKIFNMYKVLPNTSHSIFHCCLFAIASNLDKLRLEEQQLVDVDESITSTQMSSVISTCAYYTFMIALKLLKQRVDNISLSFKQLEAEQLLFSPVFSTENKKVVKILPKGATETSFLIADRLKSQNKNIDKNSTESVWELAERLKLQPILDILASEWTSKGKMSGAPSHAIELGIMLNSPKVPDVPEDEVALDLSDNLQIQEIIDPDLNTTNNHTTTTTNNNQNSNVSPEKSIFIREATSNNNHTVHSNKEYVEQKKYLVQRAKLFHVGMQLEVLKDEKWHVVLITEVKDTIIKVYFIKDDLSYSDLHIIEDADIMRSIM